MELYFTPGQGTSTMNAAIKHIEGWLGDFPSRNAAVAALKRSVCPAR
jgi:hypothetical protein